MAKLLQIAQLGNKILRKKASTIINIQNQEIQNLIDDMLLTLKDSGGVGIAAPQVYQSKKIIIISCSPSPRYPKAPKMRPLVMINPKIISYSEKTKKGFEGCLSIPGLRALVPRFIETKISFLNREGNSQTKIFKDIVSRIFQHELDHLEGVLYIDKVENTKEIYTDKEYQKMIAKK